MDHLVKNTALGRSARRCYVCQRSDNPVIADEPIETRFGMNVLPEDRYRFVRCHGCSTLYVDSDVDDAYLTRLYSSETVAGVLDILELDDHDELTAVRIPEFSAHWELMKRFRSPSSGDCLLDFGCQTGEFGAIAQRDGPRMFGVELSPDYASIAAERWGGGSTIHSGMLEDAPFSREQFAYITAFETLEHMCDPVTALRQFNEWLRDDGILAISVPSSDYFHLKYWVLARSPAKYLARRFLGKVNRSFQVLPHTHIFTFSPASVSMVLQKAGFEPIFVSPTGWHGRWRLVGGLLSQWLWRLSRRRIALAPSVFALARRPSSGSPE